MATGKLGIQKDIGVTNMTECDRVRTAAESIILIAPPLRVGSFFGGQL
jgi:hypothetical protein